MTKAEEPEMVQLMQDKPALAHKLMMGLLKNAKKRKAEHDTPSS